MVVSQLAKNIQFLRKKEKISQQALATKLGLSRSNIASYENGKAEPRATKLVRIAKYFQINLSQLIEVDLQQLSEEEFLNAKMDLEKDSFELSVEQTKIIEDFLNRSEDLNKVIDGFKEFYKFKVQNLKEMSGGVQSLIHDFENLLSVMGSLQEFNQELISFVKEVSKK